VFGDANHVVQKRGQCRRGSGLPWFDQLANLCGRKFGTFAELLHGCFQRRNMACFQQSPTWGSVNLLKPLAALTRQSLKYIARLRGIGQGLKCHGIRNRRRNPRCQVIAVDRPLECRCQLVYLLLGQSAKTANWSGPNEFPVRSG